MQQKDSGELGRLTLQPQVYDPKTGLLVPNPLYDAKKDPVQLAAKNREQAAREAQKNAFKLLNILATTLGTDGNTVIE